MDKRFLAAILDALRINSLGMFSRISCSAKTSEGMMLNADISDSHTTQIASQDQQHSNT